MKVNKSTPIYLVLFDYIESRLLNYLAKELTGVFQAEIILGAKQPLPSASFNQYRNQYRASAFLEMLKKMQLNGKVIGISNVDIYIQNFDFIFSVADPSTQVAVVSLTRLTPIYYKMYQDDSVYWMRVLKECIHATGRLYGLEHCYRQECVMHSSNSIMNIDIKSERLCGDCYRLLKEAIENGKFSADETNTVE